jgi:hypothetical protein
MTEKKAYVIEKKIWGNRRWYANCDLTITLTKILKRPSIARGVLDILKADGWEIVTSRELEWK